MSELINHPKESKESSHDLDSAAEGGVLKGSIDPVYAAKAQILNNAIQDIGMGWYQFVRPAQDVRGHN